MYLTPLYGLYFTLLTSIESTSSPLRAWPWSWKLTSKVGDSEVALVQAMVAFRQAGRSRFSFPILQMAVPVPFLTFWRKTFPERMRVSGRAGERGSTRREGAGQRLTSTDPTVLLMSQVVVVDGNGILIET